LEKKALSQPYFICVGPHKTGTSWLHSILGKHQAIKKCVIKELNYFSYHERRNNNKMLSTQFNFLWIPARKRLILKRFKKYFQSYRNDDSNGKDKQKLIFELRWILGLYNFKYYSSMFNDSNHLIGDISPEYFSLKKETILQIYQLFPDIKILLFLREPIDRHWSHIKMLFKHNRKPRTLDNLKKASSQILEHQGAYPDEGLRNWMEIFDESQLFIGYYDDLKNQPYEYFTSICRFLEISDELENVVNYQNINKRYIRNRTQYNASFNSAKEFVSFQVNRSQFDLEMPDEIKHDLLDFYYPKVEKLTKIIDSPYPKLWLQRYDEMKKDTNAIKYI